MSVRRKNGRHQRLSIALLAAVICSASSSAYSQAISSQDISALFSSPDSLLQQNNGLTLSSKVAQLVLFDASNEKVLNQIISLLARTSELQQEAIGRGLAEAATASLIGNREFSLKIQSKISLSGSAAAIRSFGQAIGARAIGFPSASIGDLIDKVTALLERNPNGGDDLARAIHDLVLANPSALSVIVATAKTLGNDAQQSAVGEGLGLAAQDAVKANNQQLAIAIQAAVAGSGMPLTVAAFTTAAGDATIAAISAAGQQGAAGGGGAGSPTSNSPPTGGTGGSGSPSETNGGKPNTNSNPNGGSLLSPSQDGGTSTQSVSPR